MDVAGWRLIKSYFSHHCAPSYQGRVSASRERKQEKAVWQRRFWEHQIRDEADFHSTRGVHSLQPRKTRFS